MSGSDASAVRGTAPAVAYEFDQAMVAIVVDAYGNRLLGEGLLSADATEIAITDALAGELSVYLTTDDLVDEGLVGEPLQTILLPYSLEVLRADGERKTCAHGYLRVLLGADA